MTTVDGPALVKIISSLTDEDLDRFVDLEFDDGCSENMLRVVRAFRDGLLVESEDRHQKYLSASVISSGSLSDPEDRLAPILVVTGRESVFQRGARLLGDLSLEDPLSQWLAKAFYDDVNRASNLPDFALVQLCLCALKRTLVQPDLDKSIEAAEQCGLRIAAEVLRVAAYDLEHPGERERQLTQIREEGEPFNRYMNEILRRP